MSWLGFYRWKVKDAAGKDFNLMIEMVGGKAGVDSKARLAGSEAHPGCGTMFFFVKQAFSVSRAKTRGFNLITAKGWIYSGYLHILFSPAIIADFRGNPNSAILHAMIAARIIHTFLLYLLAAVTYILGTTLILCVMPFAKNKTRPFQFAARYWSRMLVRLAGIRVEVSGFDNFPINQPIIIVANHQSMADIPLLLGYVPVRFRFAIKKELFNIPIFGWYLRQAGYFAVDRDLVMGGYKILKTMKKILEAGDSILIFPEGTRSRDGRLGSFKRGSFMAAQIVNVPVIPIAISGSYSIAPRGTKLIYPTAVKLSAGRLIHFNNKELYDKKVNEAREFIAKKL